MSAEALLRRNLLIYGVGGLVVPFVGIKIIDVAITSLAIGLGRHHEHHTQSLVALADDAGHDRAARHRVSPRDHRLAQIAFPDKANGQLIERNGTVIGSRIIGQAFSSPGYFRSRPSAAGTGYDAANSAGTNLGPTNKKLVDAVKANVDAVRGGESRLARAGRSGDHVCVGPGSASVAGGGGISGAARGP